MANIQQIRLNNFAAYGLNRKRNFMSAPECDMNVCLGTVKSVREFCMGTLNEHPCMEAAIFCCFKDGRYMAVIKQPDDDMIPTYLVVRPTRDRDCFSEVDSEFRLCCYGMITEVKKGLWRIED